MKLCLVSQEYPPETGGGGIGTKTYIEAQGMTARGHEVHVIAASTDAQPRETMDGKVHIHRLGLPTMGVGLIRTGEQAAIALQDGRADLIALGRELLWNPNWPMQIATEHDEADGWKLMPEQYGWWLRRRKAQQGK